VKRHLLAASVLALSPTTVVGASARNPSNVSAAPVQTINEAGLVPIGGIRQWVTAGGQDRTNPILLIVHGGPGNPSTPFAHNLYGGWTKDFTVVQWDQRGAGKTFGASKPSEGEALTLDRLTQDGVEVARYAAARFGKRKIILMGGSWGSALAVSMAQAAPDLFHAYVGTSQLVSYSDDTAASYRRTLALARAAGDADATGKLENLGTPPWTDPRASGVLRRITRKYEMKATDPAPEGWFSFGAGYDTPGYMAMYEAGEEYSFLQFVGLRGDGMGSKIDLPASATRFAMPVYLLQGEDDLVTPAEVSRAWFDRISAPKKDFIVLPRTGHDPNAAMVAAQSAVLRRVRPAAIKADRAKRTR
jgi:pimeloyl-ACP methyl ester carboxylesterase